jgi:hypothetical protein
MNTPATYLGKVLANAWDHYKTKRKHGIESNFSEELSRSHRLMKKLRDAGAFDLSLIPRRVVSARPIQQPQMKVELKKLKLHNDLSHETFCFSAVLYVDGKEIGVVENRGDGGPHRYEFKYSLHQELEQRARKITGYKFEALDSMVNDAIVEYQQRVMCMANIVFVLKSDPDVYNKIPKRAFVTEEAGINYVREKWGVDVNQIINEKFKYGQAKS